MAISKLLNVWNMNFTKPYMSSPIVIATRDSGMIENLANLPNTLKIGVAIKGYTTEQILQKIIQLWNTIHTNLVEGLEALSKGKIDGL